MRRYFALPWLARARGVVAPWLLGMAAAACGQANDGVTSQPRGEAARAGASASSAGTTAGGGATALGGAAATLGGAGMTGTGHSGSAGDDAGCTRGEDCTVTIAIDDETGSYCATKASGAYRCWTDGNAAPSTLAAARYRRVQLTALGLVGLTEEGKVVTAPDASLATHVLEGVSDFSATNMWGATAICARDAQGALVLHFLRASNQPLGPDSAFEEPRRIPGVFSRAVCAFEGLIAGVTTDGALYTIFEARDRASTLSGKDFIEVTLSFRVLCGLRRDGAISCGASYVDRQCDPFVPQQCEVFSPPAFQGDAWVDVAATYEVGCALDASGELSCLNLRGEEIFRDAGPYTAIEAGKNVVCAIRTDGTTACFSHDLDGPLGAAVLSFLPVDAGW